MFKNSERLVISDCGLHSKSILIWGIEGKHKHDLFTKHFERFCEGCCCNFHFLNTTHKIYYCFPFLRGIDIIEGDTFLAIEML